MADLSVLESLIGRVYTRDGRSDGFSVADVQLGPEGVPVLVLEVLGSGIRRRVSHTEFTRLCQEFSR